MTDNKFESKSKYYTLRVTVDSPDPSHWATKSAVMAEGERGQIDWYRAWVVSERWGSVVYVCVRLRERLTREQVLGPILLKAANTPTGTPYNWQQFRCLAWGMTDAMWNKQIDLFNTDPEFTACVYDKVTTLVTHSPSPIPLRPIVEDEMKMGTTVRCTTAMGSCSTASACRRTTVREQPAPKRTRCEDSE